MSVTTDNNINFSSQKAFNKIRPIPVFDHKNNQQYGEYYGSTQ